MHGDASASKNPAVLIFSWVKAEKNHDPVVVFLITNDSQAFSKFENRDRKHWRLPPFSHCSLCFFFPSFCLNSQGVCVCVCVSDLTPVFPNASDHTVAHNKISAACHPNSSHVPTHNTDSVIN